MFNKEFVVLPFFFFLLNVVLQKKKRWTLLWPAQSSKPKSRYVIHGRAPSPAFWNENRQVPYALQESHPTTETDLESVFQPSAKNHYGDTGIRVGKITARGGWHAHASNKSNLDRTRFISPPDAFVPLPSCSDAATQAISRGSTEIHYTASGIYLAGCPRGKCDWLSVGRARVDRKQYLHVLSEIYSSVYF